MLYQWPVLVPLPTSISTPSSSVDELLPQVVARHGVQFTPVAPVLPPVAHLVAVTFRPDDAGPVAVVPGPAGMAVPKRHAEFRAGRLSAAEALRRLDPALAHSPVPRADHGVPQFPDGVVGSITHTAGIAAAAVARTRDARSLGIDFEPVVSSHQARAIGTAVAWPCELVEGRDSGLDLGEAFTLVFSAKEALFKCLFPIVRVFFDFRDVRIVAVDAATRMFRAKVVRTLSKQVRAGAVLEGRFHIEQARVHTGILLPSGAFFS